MVPKMESKSNMLSFQDLGKAVLHSVDWQTLSAILKASAAFEHGYLAQVKLDSTLQLGLWWGSPVTGWLRRKVGGKLVSMCKISSDDGNMRIVTLKSPLN